MDSEIILPPLSVTKEFSKEIKPLFALQKRREKERVAKGLGKYKKYEAEEERLPELIRPGGRKDDMGKGGDVAKR